MKINEKNLCAYAVSPTFAADKEGYLMKKGEVNKGFQKRWFVLKGNLLFYFEKRYDKEPLGVIILEGCTVELDENDAQFSFKIVFHGMGNRSYILCAENQELMEQWMKSLACASYDYMKLMVTDLQKQLKETHCNKMSTRGVDGSTNAGGSENVSLMNTSEDFGCNNNLVTSHQAASTSPHPPPRLRSNLHSRSQTTSHVNTNHQPKIKTSGIVPVSGSFSNPSYSHHSSSRNKMNFKDIHTVYGRPVLRDRNEWRYRIREDESSNKYVARADLNAPLFREQNLLISL